MVKARVFIFERQFDGPPKEGDLRIFEEDLPSIKDGEFLAEAVYLSVDPYMRKYADTFPLGKTFVGSQVALIKESKNPNYPVGKYVHGEFGWRTHTISNGSVCRYRAPEVLPDIGDLPLSYGVGILGGPGHSAYFGLLELLNPKPGEVLVVTGAAGAVGSHVGQIAKIMKCKVIGIAGSDEKGKWLTEELGFDHFINYKTENLNKALSAIVPDGIDIYFDNVGGEISSTILKHMKLYGRVSVCGSISGYNNKNQKATALQPIMVTKQLKMEGFLATRWLDRYQEAFQQNLKWLQEGKLKYRETVTVGFENAFKAFTDMLNGKNIGKAIVQI